MKLAPRGQGAASQWVIANYAEAARQARAERHQVHLGFLIVVDGDNKGVEHRKQELFRAPQDPRQLGDRLAIWVPTWSIETWVKVLSGELGGTADDLEASSCKPEIEPRYKQLLEKAIEGWQKPETPVRLPSLEDAYRELSRLPFAAS